MTKPIEWTTTEEQPKPADLVRHQRVKIETWITGPGYDSFLRDATTSDLVAALAAMGEGERAEVMDKFTFRGNLSWTEHELALAIERCGEALARAEAAERERDRMAGEFGMCPGELPDDGEIARVVRERAEFRARAEKAERERDEAREARDRSTRLRDAMMPDTRAALDAEQYEDALTAARRVVAERDSLRSRLIAAETAAAQREPREYPLAEGSKWSGDSIVGSAGYELHTVTSDRFLVCYPGRSASAPFADVLALAHRRGLL